MGRPPGEGSPYLLVGLLRCGQCGGSMEVLSSKSGKVRTYSYRCATSRRKGTSASNQLPAPMHDTDRAVLDAIGDTLRCKTTNDGGENWMHDSQRWLKLLDRCWTWPRCDDSFSAIWPTGRVCFVVTCTKRSKWCGGW